MTGVHFTASLGLQNQLIQAGVEVDMPSAFKSNDLKSSLNKVKRSGVRIVILLASSGDRFKVGLHARQENMLVHNWAWLTVNRLNSKTKQRAQHLLQGWVFFRNVRPTGPQLDGFVEEVKTMNRLVFNVTADPDLSAYDEGLLPMHEAIMLYAHAATKVLAEGGNLHNGLLVTGAIRSTTFVGLGGSSIALDQHGDRIESYEAVNYVIKMDGELTRESVGLYNSTLKQYTAYARAAVWPGNTTNVPADNFSGPLQTNCTLLH